MSEKHPDPWSGAQPDEWEWRESEEERQHREERVETLVRRFIWVVKEAQDLWGMRGGLDALRTALRDKLFRPPKRRKGHDYHFDAALRAAYREAPPGKKMDAVYALGKTIGLLEETTRQRWRRLRRQERRYAKFVAHLRSLPREEIDEP